MANRVPLILNTSLNQIQELPTGDNLDLSNSGINNAGVITATNFSGDGSGLSNLPAGNASGLTDTPDITVGNIIAQNVSIGGTLTYEDVTNIDSVGIVTARQGVDVVGAYPITLGTGTTIHASANNTLSLGTTGIERLRIDSLGNVTLGYAGNSLYFQNGFNDSAARIQNGGASNSSNLKFLTRDAGTEGERLRITSAGKVLTGHDTALDIDSAAVYQQQLVGTNFATSGSAQYRFEAGTSGPTLAFAHSRNATKGAHTILSNGDEFGKIRFYGSDGVDFANLGAEIRALVDGAPGANDMPGALTFGTTADGATAPTERVRITKEGYVQIKYNGSATTANVPLYVGVAGKSSITYSGGTSSDTACLRIEDEGTNDNYYHGIEFRTKNSGDARIYAHDQGSSNAVDLVFATDNDSHSPEISEKLRITSIGGVIFKSGPLQEQVKITAGKLSDNTTIDLADGNVHYFTTQESTTSTPNLRVNSTTTLDSVMAVGETIAVTIITTAAAGGYSDQLQIDGSNVTENWVGGSAPTAGGGSGVDIYNYTIIKTAANTYTVIANLTKTS